MRPLLHRATFIALILVPFSALAQMHKVAKPEQVVRAVGVYEWTGDFNKPTASRLIPVSLYIEGNFQDAGIYIARPVPFALLTDTVYELQDAGIGKGLLDLSYARHLQATDATGDLAYDDGWFGYGSVKPLAAPRKAAALKPSKTLPVLNTSKSDNPAGTSTASTSTDPDRPTMKRRDSSEPTTSSAPGSTTPASSTTTPAAASTASTSTSDDPDRPTMKRRSPDSSTPSSTGTTTDSANSTTASSTPSGDPSSSDPDRPVMKRRDSSTTTDSSSTSTPSTTSKDSSTTSTPADDPDRPTMTRRSPTNSTGSSGTTTAGADDPSSSDPDRPTLKRHSPEEAKKAKNDSASVTGLNSSLNDDPDRPNLHRGKPTQALTETDLPKLTGLPQNLHQMVAVSDAVNRDPHPFTLAWEDATQRTTILQKMQEMARAKLAAYGAPPTPPTPAPAVRKPSSPQTHHATKLATPPLLLLADEELKAYTLSYGGDPTYIYSAHTAGTGSALRYVTIVAQANGLGDLKPAIQSVTDAAHLDRTPLMRFIDVVDAEASNRASLLFELRSQNARQFALYRVIAAHPEQIFLTGTTQ